MENRCVEKLAEIVFFCKEQMTDGEYLDVMNWLMEKDKDERKQKNNTERINMYDIHHIYLEEGGGASAAPSSEHTFDYLTYDEHTIAEMNRHAIFSHKDTILCGILIFPLFILSLLYLV